MKTLTIVAALMLLTSAPAAFAAGSHVPSACVDGTAPSGWLRAGGYCDIVANGNGSTSKKGAGCDGGLKWDRQAAVCVPE